MSNSAVNQVLNLSLLDRTIKSLDDKLMKIRGRL